MPKTSDCFLESQALARSILQKPHFLISLEGAVGRVAHNSPYWKRTDEVPHESHGPYNPTLSLSLSGAEDSCQSEDRRTRGKSYKAPQKKRGRGGGGGRMGGGGTDIIKSKRLVANARRYGSKETLLIFRGLDNGRACPSLSLPRRLAWPRCHREWWTDRWRDGGMQAEEEEENKCIVLGAENGVLWRGQIAYVGEQGAEKDRGRWKLAEEEGGKEGEDGGGGEEEEVFDFYTTVLK